MVQDCEFVTSIAEAASWRLHGCSQSPGNVLQHCIAGRVAERVIDLLESVYIDHQQRKSSVGVLRIAKQSFHGMAERAFSAQLGQIIGC